MSLANPEMQSRVHSMPKGIWQIRAKAYMSLSFFNPHLDCYYYLIYGLYKRDNRNDIDGGATAK